MDPETGHATGQNHVWFFGIYEREPTPAWEPEVVGITSHGDLGRILKEYLPKGPQGDPGIQGEKGDKGDPGIQEEKGVKGDKGDMGPMRPGLIPGSALFLLPQVPPPAGYSRVGIVEFNVKMPDNRTVRTEFVLYVMQ